VNRTDQPVMLSVGQEGAALVRQHGSARPPLSLQPPRQRRVGAGQCP
jgi:hypothetical protein